MRTVSSSDLQIIVKCHSLSFNASTQLCVLCSFTHPHPHPKLWSVGLFALSDSAGFNSHSSDNSSPYNNLNNSSPDTNHNHNDNHRDNNKVNYHGR